MTLSVGIVITAHNQAAFLEEALMSVARQTRRPDQVVLVDDGSTDETEDVIRSLGALSLDVQVVRRCPARGVASTYNDGVAATKTDVVLILNADDRLPSNYLERTIRHLETGADFVTTPLRRFGADDRLVVLPPPTLREVAVENTVHISSPFRRSCFDQVGGFRDVDLEDWDFWIRVLSDGARGEREDSTWLEYRRHGDGSRNSATRRRSAEAHFRTWWRNRKAVPATSLVRWLLRSAFRNVAQRRFQA